MLGDYKIESFSRRILLEIGTVVPHLKQVIGAEGFDLLIEYKMLWSLIKGMLIRRTIEDSEIHISEEQFEEERSEYLRENGYDSPEDWLKLIERSGQDEEALSLSIKERRIYKEFLKIQYSSASEARFLQRKDELDGVVYSLLRLRDRFLAQELYLQIESGESSFSDLARMYAEGPERSTNGIVGPVSLMSAHPELAEKLRVSRPGTLMEPFLVEGWWLVVRLENYSPAVFNSTRSFQMCHEMFRSDIECQADLDFAQIRDELSQNNRVLDFSDPSGLAVSE